MIRVDTNVENAVENAVKFCKHMNKMMQANFQWKHRKNGDPAWKIL